MVYKFETFEEASTFCDYINTYEGYPKSDLILKYCEPVPLYNDAETIAFWLVIKDSVTEKYYDAFKSSI